MNEEDRFDTGALIRELRGSMSQEQFAQEMGVGRTTIVRYEANERVPDAEFLLRLNVRYKVDPLHVLTGQRPNTVTLESNERQLLDLYRAAPASLKNAIEAVAALEVSGRKAPKA